MLLASEVPSYASSDASAEDGYISGSARAMSQQLGYDDKTHERQKCIDAMLEPVLMALKMKDAAIPSTLKQPVLWVGVMFSAVSVYLRLASEADFEHSDGEDSYGEIMSHEIDNISSTISYLNFAMVFFLSFLNTALYSRWMANWECTQVGYGRINDLNVLVPAYMQDTPKLGADVLRFVNAYHHLVYFSTMGHPEQYALQVCLERRLLTATEVARMGDMVGSKGMRCLIWAAQSITASGIDSYRATHLNEMIVLLRRNMAFIWSYDDQGVPFVYSHAVYFCVTIVILAQSCFSAFGYIGEFLDDDGRVMHWKVVMVICTNFVWAFTIIMLREVSRAISDPFSSCQNGINAERYLDLHVTGTSTLVHDSATHPVDIDQDPCFAKMAVTDKATWEFKPRPTMSTNDQRLHRLESLRLKSAE